MDIPKPDGGKRPLGIPTVLCRSAAQAEAALAAVGEILIGLRLRLHPDRTRVVDLREGREGLDFLGCHYRARMSGRLWERRGIVRYYLHRRPSQRGRNLPPGQVLDWDDDWFNGHGLHRMRGTVRYPRAA